MWRKAQYRGRLIENQYLQPLTRVLCLGRAHGAEYGVITGSATGGGGGDCDGGPEVWLPRTGSSKLRKEIPSSPEPDSLRHSGLSVFLFLAWCREEVAHPEYSSIPECIFKYQATEQINIFSKLSPRKSRTENLVLTGKDAS